MIPRTTSAVVLLSCVAAFGGCQLPPRAWNGQIEPVPLGGLTLEDFATHCGITLKRWEYRYEGAPAQIRVSWEAWIGGEKTELAVAREALGSYGGKGGRIRAGGWVEASCTDEQLSLQKDRCRVIVRTDEELAYAVFRLPEKLVAAGDGGETGRFGVGWEFGGGEEREKVIWLRVFVFAREEGREWQLNRDPAAPPAYAQADAALVLRVRFEPHEQEGGNAKGGS